MRYVIFPADAPGRALVGGKGAALAALPAGLDVPPWFALTPDAFDASLTDDEGAARAAGRTPDLAGLAPAPDVAAEIDAALRTLGAGPFAVRSSAVDEDGAGASFAGQYATFLDVPAEDVAARVADVWRSAFRAHVAEYRVARDYRGSLAAPAVLVQTMVRPDAAGVAFSADPASGRRQHAVVAAVRGLGDALVDGTRAGDLYRVGADGAVFEREAEAGGAGDGASGGAAGFVLSDADAARVAALARRLEAHFGGPQDVEWALEGGRLWVLQSRPITTLRALADPDGAPALWDNANIAESYSGVTTPFTFAFARSAYASVYRAWLRLMRVPEARMDANADVFRRLIGLVRGRFYYHLPSWYALLALLPGFRVNRPFMEAMMGLRAPLPPEMMPAAPPATRAERRADAFALARTALALAHAYRTLDARIAAFYARVDAALDGPAPATMRLDELARAYRRVEDRLLAAWDAPLVNDFLCMIAFGLTKALAARWAPGAPGLHDRLVTPGGGVVSAEPPRLVRALADALRPDAATVDALRHAPAAEALAALRAHPAAASLFDAYLARFGDRCLDELKLESPALTDDPTPLLRTIGALAARADTFAEPAQHPSPAVLVRDAVPGRGAASRLRRWALAALAVRARRLVAGRENLRFERTRVFGHARRLVRAMGTRLVAEGVLDDVDSVFYLEPHELLGFAEGTATTTDLAGLARVRRAEYDRYRALPAPADRFRTAGAVHVGNRFEADAEAAEAETGDARTGLGCGQGVVVGTVRVVRDPRGVSVEAGEILVAERTDPGWITLFAACAGVVVERGSLLSHAAIVARELGLPAVVSLPGATRWLRDGDRIRVEGGTGRVTLLERAGAPAPAEQPVAEACDAV